MENERIIAYRIIDSVLNRGESLKLSFEINVQNCENINIPLIKEMSYGTIRYKLYLDYIIQLFTNKRIGDISKNVRNIVRLAVYQIEFMKRKIYAVVNEMVELTDNVCSKQKKFVNWILREFLRNRDNKKVKINDKLRKLSIEYSFPIHFVEYIYKRRGENETRKLLSFYNKPAMSYAIDIDTLNMREVENNKIENNEYIISPSYKIMMDELLKGIDIDNGYIYDCCAAPGGKSVLLKSIFRKSKIFVNDINAQRIELMKRNISRLNIDNIEFFNEDFLIFDINRVFDMVVLDVPCSATGTINKNPDIKYNYRKRLNSLIELQKAFIQRADLFVKEKGFLFYITCSILEEENQLIVKYFLNKNKNYELYNQYFNYGNPYSGAYGVLLYKKEV